MPNILKKIVIQKRKAIEAKKKNLPLIFIKKSLKKQTTGYSFKNALLKKGKVALIAEIKKASPSAGVIKQNLNIKKIIDIYNEAGVSAISVITEENFFQGNIQNLVIAKKMAKVPILRKDFIIDSYQIYESKFYGADAILLIATVLDNRTIDRFIKIARTLNMDCLVETHNLKELNRILETNAEIIGINNRDLKTFKINLQTSLNLAPKIPSLKIIVSESGIENQEDVKKLKKVGVSAILVGTALIKSKNIFRKIKQLTL
ncbi:indole-3-glycerol phosphate synthase TrpC [Candidatus Parcubacteria bacterium]|nr:indole-3-glycerol phosphate synthase TrpC [Candidatus Parcubacteria bacterium]